MTSRFHSPSCHHTASVVDLRSGAKEASIRIVVVPAPLVKGTTVLPGQSGGSHTVSVRLFVAVWPDDSVSRRLGSLELGRVPGIRPVAPGQLHVTLRFLGEVDEGLLADLVAALEGAAGTIGGPIHCEAGPATAWFPGGRVLQVPVVGLEEAADAVHDATRSLVPAPGHRGRFTGHLTLGRARVGRLPAAAREALARIPFSASFDVESFDLVASDLSAGGPRYRSLRRVPLRVGSEA